MSNTDFEEQSFSPEQYFSGVDSSVASTVNDDPEKAARAYSLEQTTGAPGRFIYNNDEEFNSHFKTGLAMDIVHSNSKLMDYVNSHPLAASVSNDDYANLDGFSKGASQTGSWLHTLRVATGKPLQGVHDVVTSAAQGGLEAYQEGFGPQHFGEWLPGAGDPNQRLRWSISAAGWAPFEWLGRAAAGLMNMPFGIARGAGEGVARALGYDQNDQERLGREFQGMVESEMGRAGAEPETSTIVGNMQRLQEAQVAAKPWIENGVMPPRGVHPLIDEALTQVNSNGVAKLEGDLQNAQLALTKERSPELFNQFVQQHYGDSTIGIHGDAVSAMYGDRVPTADDGMLGWVPGIEDKLTLARETGADVHVPVSDWISKVDPAVANGLRDDIRMWPGGITAREATEVIPPKAVVDAPLAQVRSASGLEPMFSIGDRKLSLLQTEPTEYQKQFLDQTGLGLDTFNIADENGRNVGQVEITPDPEKKQLYVQMINGMAGFKANSFGPALMKDLLRQLKTYYPDYDTITGHRVSGARMEAEGGMVPQGESAHPVIRFDKDIPSVEDFQNFHNILDDAWLRHDPRSGLQAHIKPTDMLTEKENDLISAVSDELAKMTGGQAVSVPAWNLEHPRFAGQFLEGAFVPGRQGHVPYILYGMFGDNTLGVARHEGIHWLKNQGFFTDQEWGTLSNAAKEEGWLSRYGILDRYRDMPPSVQIEESIADAYKEWAANKDLGYTAEGPISSIFQKMQDLWENIKKAWAQILGKEPSFEDLFEQVRSGDIGQRTTLQDMTGIDGVRASIGEELGNLRAGALGLDKPTWEQLQKSIQDRYEADIAKAQERAEREQRREQTKTWKQNKKDVGQEVEATIRQRPDVAADLFLGSGELHGEKLKQRYTLREDELSDAQKASLPNHYVSKNGLPPDGVARMFGFQSGDQLVQALSEYNLAKAGKTPQEMLRSVIDSETERQMQLRYGNLEDNIMSEAQDQALSDADMHVMADETVAASMKAGLAPVDRKVLQAHIAEQFGKAYNASSVSSSRLMEQVAIIARQVDRAAIGGDWATAAQLMQRKLSTFMLAREAKKFEMEQAKFNTLARRYAKPWDPTKSMRVPADFNIFIRDTLQRAGLRNGMSLQGLAKAITESRFNDFSDFITKTEDEHEIDGLQFPVPDWMMKDFRKPVAEMTVDEFREFNNAVTSMDHVGRMMQKVLKGGEEIDRKELTGQMAKQVQEKFDAKGVPATRRFGDYSKDAMQKMLAASTSNETLMSRFDGRDPHGLFTETVSYPAADASNLEARLQREISGDYAKLGKLGKGNLDSPLIDPLTGRPVTNFTRQNLAAVVSNMGNDYNWKVFCKGWGVDPDLMWRWVERNTTAEDIDRAQELGGIFSKLKGKADTVYQHLYGISPENIQVRPFAMHGKQYDGWYHPIIGDPARSRFVNKLEPEKEVNFWPSTSNAYMKRRTGAIQVVDITHDAIPAKIQQIIHDISFREFVSNTSRIFKDDGLRQAITGHYGLNYMQEIDAWIKRVAGNASYNSAAMSLASKMSNELRQNVISTQIAFNLGTVEKHGLTALAMSARELGPNLFKTVPEMTKVMAEVAPSLFKAAVRDLYGKSPELGDGIYGFIHANSEEIQRRDRNFLNTMMGQQQIMMGKSTLRNRFSQAGAKLVAFSDLMSAAPLWLAKYRGELAASGSHGDAVRVADQAVRRAHGSTAITNLPRIAAGNDPLSPWLASLYGFMGTNMQRRIEIFHDLNDAFDLGMQGDLKAAAGKLPSILSSLAVYVVYTGLVEEGVRDQFTDDKRGLGWKALDFASGTVAQTVIGLRDLAYDLQHGEESVGLIGTPIHDVHALFRDLGKHDPTGRAHAGRLVQDFVTTMGDLYGVGPKHIGTMMRYGIDVFNGFQHPHDAGDWYRGLMTGKQQRTTIR